jgi:hypothetical protein
VASVLGAFVGVTESCMDPRVLPSSRVFFVRNSRP